jgi:hypothetical protein
VRRLGNTPVVEDEGLAHRYVRGAATEDERGDGGDQEEALHSVGREERGSYVTP